MQGDARIAPVENVEKIEARAAAFPPDSARGRGAAFAESRGAMSREGNSRWYVLRTKPRAEAFATAGLRSRHVEVYFPKLLLCGWGRPGGDVASPNEPLFPGYLFVRLDLAQDFARVAWTPGVRNFLSFGDDVPESIQDEVVELLRSRAGGGDVLRPRELLRAGETVEVRTGPFAGLLGIIDRPVSAAGRVQVLLEILRRQTRVDLDAEHVVAL
jgi:transcriptional antiterminator RfaH